ncbi:MAG: methionyl-tRNA formyltransferase [bacterium]
MVRILFMGTPEFATPSLDKIANSKYELIGVITQPDKPAGRSYKLTPPKVKELANKLNLKVWQPISLKNEGSLGLVKELKPDLVVVVAFGQILSKEFLQIPKIGSINLHASLLPKYRGASPIHHAIIQGETKTGVTVAWISEKLDAGDIILQQEVDIQPTDTTGILLQKLSFIGAKLLLKAINLIDEGKAPRIKQDPSQVSYAPKLNKKDELIDWKKSNIEIHNLVRALNPFPGAYTYYKNQILKLWTTEIIEEEGTPGEIVKIFKDKGPVIGTEKGCLLIRELQPANKKRLSGTEFISGYRIKVGETFTNPPVINSKVF